MVWTFALKTLNTIVQARKTIVGTITNHHCSQALFRAFSSKHFGLKLLKRADTRFATHFINYVGKITCHSKSFTVNGG